MKNVKTRMEQFSIIFFFVMLSWAIVPWFLGETIDMAQIASSIIMVMVGIAYPLVIFKPEWNKGMLFVEGIIIAILGYMALGNPYNYVFLLFGLILVFISILAYMRKLPSSLLKWFYRNRK